MTIAKCVFCGKEQEDYKGTYFVKNDGSVLYFSSSKCLKNHLKLRRDKRRVRWTEAFHLQRKKRLDKVKEIAEKAKEKGEREEKKVEEKTEKPSGKRAKKSEKPAKNKG